MVDEATQRAVWKAADGTNPNLVMESGVYNLTQDKADVLVHFGPEKTETARLVRFGEDQMPAAAKTSAEAIGKFAHTGFDEPFESGMVSGKSRTYSRPI